MSIILLILFCLLFWFSWLLSESLKCWVNIFPLFLFQFIAWSDFVLLTLTLSATLTAQVCPVELDEILWYAFRRLGHVINCSISVPTDYVIGSVLCVDVTDYMIDGVHIRIVCHFWCRQGVLCRTMRPIFGIYGLKSGGSWLIRVPHIKWRTGGHLRAWSRCRSVDCYHVQCTVLVDHAWMQSDGYN